MRDESARLKNLVTGSHVQIEQKGLEPISVENQFNMVLLTNEDNAVKIENEDR